MKWRKSKFKRAVSNVGRNADAVSRRFGIHLQVLESMLSLIRLCSAKKIRKHINYEFTFSSTGGSDHSPRFGWIVCGFMELIVSRAPLFFSGSTLLLLLPTLWLPFEQPYIRTVCVHSIHVLLRCILCFEINLFFLIIN